MAEELAATGWDLALTQWRPYDERMPWGSDGSDLEGVVASLRVRGARVVTVEVDLESPDAAPALFDQVRAELGDVTALVLSHAESVDSDIRTTTIESFDRHMAVNARAAWLLIREYALRLRAPFGAGRIVALTSDHTAHNLPYGASKGALDRIVVAAARELADLGVSANVVNPGATDTGWMSDEQLRSTAAASPLGRVGLPSDAAALVGFLCSPRGGWVNGQVLHSDGGIHT